MGDETRQELVDAFYWRNRPCCAGCDHWQHLNSHVGECTKAAPVSGVERVAMVGITHTTLPIGAGHPFTRRDHACGDFTDTFDWSSLPPWYRRAIGCPTLPQSARELG